MPAVEGVVKLLFLVVVEDDAPAPAEAGGNKCSASFRYTRSVLQSTIQLMGCKARHAFKISQRVFEMMRSKYLTEKTASKCMEVSSKDAKVYPQRETKYYFHPCMDKDVDQSYEAEDKSENKPFELYKRRTTMVVGRMLFLDVVCEALSEYKYVGPNQRAYLVLACSCYFFVFSSLMSN